MNEYNESRRPRLTLYVVGVLVLLLIVMWVWKGIAVSRVAGQVEAERAQLLEKQAELEQRLQDAVARREQEMLRLLGVPLGWAVRTEAISEDYDQIAEYATTLLKEPRVRQVVLTGADGNVRVSTDQKLQGQSGAAVFGDLVRQNEITLEKDPEGRYRLMVPILGYNARLGSLVVTFEGA